MAKFGDLVKRAIPLHIDIHADIPFTVEYSLSRMTLAGLTGTQEDARKAKTPAERVRIYAESLAQVLTGWDLVDDDDTPTALTSENLAALGEVRLGYVWNQIMENTYPNPTTDGESSSPSDIVAESE